MAKRTVHVCLNVRGALLNWKDEDFASLIRGDDGRMFSPREAKAALLDELEKGHVVIPFGEPCEGFDYGGGGCPGHDEPGGGA